MAASQQYEIAIGNASIRIISLDAAETTYRRWSQSPDVVLRGDLESGFSWEWPNDTRMTIKPLPDAAPVADQAADARASQAVTS